MADCCANCESPLLQTIENDHFEVAQENGDETPGLVTVSEAVALILAYSRILNQNCCEANTIRLCSKCLPVLSELYTLYRRFRNQSTGSSYIQRRLSDPHWEPHDVNCINNPDKDLLGLIKEEEEEHGDENWCQESILSNIRDDVESDFDFPLPTRDSSTPDAHADISARLRFRKARLTALHHRVKKTKSKTERTPSRRRRVERIATLPSRQSIRLVEKMSFDSVPELLSNSELQNQDHAAESQKPFGCNKCDPPRRFTTAQHLGMHNRALHRTYDGSQREFICQYCGVEFQGERGLRKHFKVDHQEVLKFNCENCPKTFSRLSSLSQHLKFEHVGYSAEDMEKNFCVVCGKVYTAKCQLVNHLQKIHSVREARECRECHKIFFNEKYFEHHMALTHPDKRQPIPGFDCGHCGKTYSSKNGLQSHVDIVHLNKKEFVCELCGYKTSTRKNLHLHQETHNPNREKKYSCPTCYKLFTSRAVVNKHITIHLPNGLNCICQYCGKSLTTPSSLKRHVQAKHRDVRDVANDTKSYPCPICGKNFKVKDYLTQHLRSKSHGGTGRHQNQLPSRQSEKAAGKAGLNDDGDSSS